MPSSGTTPQARVAPPRRFENYILTRVVDTSAGLTTFKDSDFTLLNGPPDYTGFTIGQGLCDDGSSFPTPIGFDFEFDGIVYKHFVANVNGFMVLVDPTLGTWTQSECLSGAIWQNPFIKPTFTSSAVLLAPWFDDLRNIAASAAQLGNSEMAGGAWSADKVNRIATGLEPRPTVMDERAYGVRVLYDKRSPQGRRTIIRWNALSNYSVPSTVIKFECVLYENGTIEYRYTTRAGLPLASSFQGVGQGSFEGATIGIFMPGGTNRFRDFAIGLGYRDGARQEYIYGGYVYDPHYTDSLSPGNEDYPATAAYTINLTPYQYWPGLNTGGSVFTFSPPLNRRKVLPRLAVKQRDGMLTLPTIARTGDSRLGNRASYYDDRRSPQYNATSSSLIVNYPTTLPRFFGGSAAGTLERQNLFSGDMLVTGSISKSAVEPYLGESPITYTDAFNESRRPEESPTTLASSFYATGSSVAAVGAGFDKPLKSKTHIKFQLPLDTSIQMPGSQSAIYYYNQHYKCWEVPANSSYALDNYSSSPPAVGGGDLSTPQRYLSQAQFPEDFRGFGPTGNLVASGTHITDSVAQAQTDANFYQQYDNTQLVKYIGRSYAKSVRVNDKYAPSADETFTIPITQPFLVEKATFEIPIAVGPGWFADKTQCFAPIGGGSFAGGAVPFDFGGPALTVALMRHVPLQEQGLSGQSHGSQFINKTSLRDLIMTGTITHTLDYVSGVVMSSFSPTSTAFQVRPVGFLNYANPAGAVVAAPRNLSFTGSVTVQAQATSVAGTDLAYAVSFGGSGPQNQASAATLLTQPILNLGTGVSNNNSIFTLVTNFISSFGRAGDGFQQAGRAILGNEYATLQNTSDPTGTTTVNPLYVAAKANQLPAQIQQALTQVSGGAGLTATAIVSLKSHFPSPYLLMPGDHLVLSISKARPFTYTQSSTQLSGSAHDITLMPGAINVTLYGSQVAGGAEYHDTLNQPLASDTVHEIIGADPVLDQFEPAYRFEYTGSFTDNVMIGTMLTSMVKNGQLSFTTGSRYRAISSLEPTISASIFFDLRSGDPVHDKYVVNGITASYPFPSASLLPPINVYNSVPGTLDLTLFNAQINDSKAYRTQPWTEQVGTNRISQFIDDSERYWDSLMPAIDQAFAADGCGIFVTRYGAFGNAQQVNVVASSQVGQSSLITSPTQQPLGWIWFDYQLPVLVDNPAGASLAPLINSNWTKAFPFEPRYQGVNRQLSVSKGLIATYLYQPAVLLPNNGYIPAGNPIVQSIPPTPVSGFMFGPVQQGTSVDSTVVGSYTAYHWVFVGYFYGYPLWLYLPYQVPILGLVYTQGDTCNAWLGDAAVGPPAPLTSSVTSSAQTFGLNPYGYFTTSSAGIDDISRALFGFGDSNTYFQRTNFDGTQTLLGTGHYADFRDQEGPHPNGTGINGTDNNIFKFSPKIRGWKYGVASGLPLFSKAYWRRGRFGQFRDMLEQRPYTKYYESPENGPTDPSFQQGVKESCVTVKYLSPDGRLTEPSNTWSSNLSFECTSSFPYIEGVPTNRPTVNKLALNKHILSFRQDIFGNLRL